ncbi:MAG: hypothetical protein M0P17_12860 [Methanoculleus sp.]|nr:hypothetical protein [Methanoculleus sp.]
MPWYTTADTKRDAERAGRPEWAKIGDMLTPIPAWNASEAQKRNHLPDKVEVLDVIPACSQSGVLYRVKTLGGDLRDLDAAWFETPNDSLTGAEGVRLKAQLYTIG